MRVLCACEESQAACTEFRKRGHPAWSCDLLVIDDSGKEQPTEWTLTQLFRIVDGRYAAMRPPVVTSQYERPDLARRLPGTGTRRRRGRSSAASSRCASEWN